MGTHFEVEHEDSPPPQPAYSKDKFSSIISQLKQINSDRIVQSQLCHDEMTKMGKEREQQTFNLKILKA
jgi:hypothetical protein